MNDTMPWQELPTSQLKILVVFLYVLYTGLENKKKFDLIG